jgi:hypothetical protein
LPTVCIPRFYGGNSAGRQALHHEGLIGEVRAAWSGSRSINEQYRGGTPDFVAVCVGYQDRVMTIFQLRSLQKETARKLLHNVQSLEVIAQLFTVCKVSNPPGQNDSAALFLATVRLSR